MMVLHILAPHPSPAQEFHALPLLLLLRLLHRPPLVHGHTIQAVGNIFLQAFSRSACAGGQQKSSISTGGCLRAASRNHLHRRLSQGTACVNVHLHRRFPKREACVNLLKYVLFIYLLIYLFIILLLLFKYIDIGWSSNIATCNLNTSSHTYI